MSHRLVTSLTSGVFVDNGGRVAPAGGRPMEARTARSNNRICAGETMVLTSSCNALESR
jgi:hypothetical protein